MRLWCCLCFNDEEEEDNSSREDNLSCSMREINFFENDENEHLPDDNIVNDDEALVEPDTTLSLAVNNRREREEEDDFDLAELINRPRVRPPSFDLPHRTFRRFFGESSSAQAGVSNGGLDSQRKRAKVLFDFDQLHYAMQASSKMRIFSASMDHVDQDTIQRLPVQSHRGPGNNGLILMDTAEKCNSDSNCMKESDGDGSDISILEDIEVKMDFTDDLLHMVFSFLGHRDLCKAASVCRQWRAASAHEDFWRCLDFEDRDISVDQCMLCVPGSESETCFDCIEEKFIKALYACTVSNMCTRYPNATSMKVSGPSIHRLAIKAISSLRNLEAITLGKGQIADDFFQTITTNCPMLRRLDIKYASLGNGVQEIAVNHDRLHHLLLTRCRLMRISIRCPQLEKLSLKRSNMAQAGLNCPLLRELDLGSCHKLPDAAIRAAAISCPQLVSLDLFNCSYVSDETLREISNNCANLSYLDASYCPNISLESVRLPMLTVLKLDYCEGITSASMVAISSCYFLEVLLLDNCSLLTSVSLELPHLQSISLVHCRKFADLDLRTTMLSSVVISNCPALRRVNVTSNSLRKLALKKQDSLTSLALHCQSLQEVDLSDCESLTSSICDVFGDGGGCPMLKSLILDNCEGLKEVQFISSSLVSLSLVGCRAIITLELLCPNLDRVCLDGCDHLERASFCPVALQCLNLGICPKLSMISIEAPFMVSLELKGCGFLSEASINCPLLASMDASFCSQLTDDCLSATAASCPLIESLILMSCPSIGSYGLSSLHCLQNLTFLDLSYTFLMDLQPVFESCSKLKVLKLQACKYLADSSLEPLYKRGALPALRELDLSYGTLCQSAIEELLAFCTQLTHVSLNGCVNMHDLNWGFDHGQATELSAFNISSSMISNEHVHGSSNPPNRLLQNLNCVGCQNIRKVLIPPMAHCWNMLYLNLSLSANLKEVYLTCQSLCSLNLSNCSSLEVLKLDCPRLTTLFLQSCIIVGEAVEAAISKCNMLETLDVRFCPKISSISVGRFRVVCPSLKRILRSLSI